MTPVPRSRRGVIAQSAPVVKEGRDPPPRPESPPAVGGGPATPANRCAAGGRMPGAAPADPQPLLALGAALNSSAVIFLTVLPSCMSTKPPDSAACFS